MKLDRYKMRRQYDADLLLFSRLRDEMMFIVTQELNKAHIRYQSISSRIKTFDSMIDKAERLNIKEPLTRMHDIVGLRVVCLFLSDVERVGMILRQSFNILREDNKIDGQEVSSFGYMSHHFVVKMQAQYAGPRYEGIADLIGEIQVRTIAMEAWAACSHFLDYKTALAVPKDLRRDFYALSGLFYLADRHFELFFKARELSREQVAERKPESDDEVNYDTLVGYMRDRFPDREHDTSPEDISDLVDELLAAGIRTLGQIESLFEKHWDAVMKEEEESPPSDEWGYDTSYSDVGVVRSLLYIERPDIKRRYQSVVIEDRPETTPGTSENEKVAERVVASKAATRSRPNRPNKPRRQPKRGQ